MRKFVVFRWFVIALPAVAAVSIAGAATTAANAQTDPYSSASPPGPIVTPTHTPSPTPTPTPTPTASPTQTPSPHVSPTSMSSPSPRVHVRSTQITRQKPPPVAPGSNRVLRDEQPGSLPFTGADFLLYLGTGVAAIGTGATILRASRSRRASDDASGD